MTSAFIRLHTFSADLPRGLIGYDCPGRPVVFILSLEVSVVSKIAREIEHLRDEEGLSRSRRFMWCARTPDRLNWKG
jgi:hypothetical protein